MTKRGPNSETGIKQIAATLGISIGTVDRALHGRDGVSPRTRDRILKTAQRLNYSPNLAARNLKLNRHIRVGVFLPKEIGLFFDLVRTGIRAASQTPSGINVDVEFHSYPRLGEGDVEAMERHRWRQFDGIILAPGYPARLSAISLAAEEEKKPVVHVASSAARAHPLCSVAVESFISGGIAAELLGQLLPARRSVVAMTGDLGIEDHAEKLRGFAATLATLAPHLTMLPVVESHESPKTAYQAAVDVLTSAPNLGGIYINTANSIPVMSALKETGRLHEVRVIATDLFTDLADLIEKGQVFATLHQRPFTQGRLAFEALVRYLAGGIQPRRSIRLSPHVVLRSNLPLFLNLQSQEETDLGAPKGNQLSHLTRS